MDTSSIQERYLSRYRGNGLLALCIERDLGMLVSLYIVYLGHAIDGHRTLKRILNLNFITLLRSRR